MLRSPAICAIPHAALAKMPARPSPPARAGFLPAEREAVDAVRAFRLALARLAVVGLSAPAASADPTCDIRKKAKSANVLETKNQLFVRVEIESRIYRLT